MATGNNIIYDGTKSIKLKDFEVQTYSIEGDNSRIRAKGRFEIKGNTIVISRENTEGIFGINLRSYYYEDNEYPFLPKNETISGKRLVSFFCEAKVSVGSCYLELKWFDNDTNGALDLVTLPVSQDTWFPISVHTQLSPSVNCFIKLKQHGLSEPNVLFIRNITLVEYANRN